MDEAGKIAEKLEQLGRFSGFLRRNRAITRPDLERDYELRSAIERNLQLALECSLEIGEIIIAHEGLRKPETYREVIEILGEHGILPKPFAKRFAKAAGLRNILVHQYADLDLGLLVRLLKKDVGDFDRYARHVARFAAKKK